HRADGPAARAPMDTPREQSSRARELARVSMNATIPTAWEIYFGANAVAAGREDLFFHSIELRNGTRKTTRHHRLDDLNALVQPLLPPQRPLEIMDVAVSS